MPVDERYLRQVGLLVRALPTEQSAAGAVSAPDGRSMKPSRVPSGYCALAQPLTIRQNSLAVASAS